ncbi:hypothetical protein D5086_011155 [Populus alba]|uniref:Uncharacterized protein n=1 Tax=Populus alba TaxID=43335 RepID=A0ACC4CD46_POPAL
MSLLGPVTCSEKGLVFSFALRTISEPVECGAHITPHVVSLSGLKPYKLDRQAFNPPEVAEGGHLFPVSLFPVSFCPIRFNAPAHANP